MILVDNIMKGDFLQDVYGNIGFVYEIDDVIHIQLLEGPDAGQSAYNLISPVPLTENFLKKNLSVSKETDNEYSYEDPNPLGTDIYVSANSDGKFYVEVVSITSNFSKDIQYVHELQHIFKMFNVKIEWVL